MENINQKKEYLSFMDVTTNPFTKIPASDIRALETSVKNVLNQFSNLNSKYNIKGKSSTTSSYTNRYDVTGLDSEQILRHVKAELESTIMALTSFNQSEDYEANLREAVNVEHKRNRATKLVASLSSSAQRKLSRELYNRGVSVSELRDGSTEIVIPSNTSLKMDGKQINAVRHVKGVIKEDIDQEAGGPLNRIYDAVMDKGELSKKDKEIAHSILTREALSTKTRAIKQWAKIESAKLNPDDPENARILRKAEADKLDPIITARTFKGTEEEKELIRKQEEKRMGFAVEKRKALVEWAKRNPDTIEGKRILSGDKNDLQTIGASVRRFIALYLLVKVISGLISKIYDKITEFGASIRGSFLEAQRANITPAEKREYEQIYKTTGINMVPYISSVGKLTRSFYDGTGGSILEKGSPLFTLQGFGVVKKIVDQINAENGAVLRDTAETIIGSTLLSVIQGKSVEKRRKGSLEPGESFVKLSSLLENIFPGSGDVLGGLFSLYQKSPIKSDIEKSLNRGDYRKAFEQITISAQTAGVAGASSMSSTRHDAVYDATLSLKETGALFGVIGNVIKQEILLGLFRLAGLFERVALFIAKIIGAEDVVKEISASNNEYNEKVMSSLPVQKDMALQNLSERKKQFVKNYPEYKKLIDNVSFDEYDEGSFVYTKLLSELQRRNNLNLLNEMDGDEAKDFGSVLSSFFLLSGLFDFERKLSKQSENYEKGETVYQVHRTPSIIADDASRYANQLLENIRSRNTNLKNVTKKDVEQDIIPVVDQMSRITTEINILSTAIQDFANKSNSKTDISGEVLLKLNVNGNDVGTTRLIENGVLDNVGLDLDLGNVVGSGEAQ